MKPIIQCTNVTKGFGSKTVLQQLNFELTQGDTAALIGPNGAGKTTLFSIICGYLRQDSGSVSLFGHKPGSSALFGQVAALPQDARFDPAFSIGEQLDFYGRLQGLSSKAARQETLRVLTLVDLAEQVQQKAAALSHGMCKRAAIAQAFIGSPQLILLDEPTAGLDPVNALHIRQLINRLSGDVSFMISSHNIFELEQLCNKVLYLEHGKLQADTTSENEQQLQQYLTLQLEDDNTEVVTAAIGQLPGLLSIRPMQKKELQLCYDPQQNANFDLELLQCLAANGWRYRNLTKGQTLEQKLFNTA
ncbi:ABC transporter ATP-binding protein [Alkalimonas collagenimarina]|uniref:ABC transporter ATP-binding protein n=1 Tax=Alkalimonas collagenimarina TaxID=400390 RepID=A0ABT9GWN7_9GAMM|nr:ABC transporter ATP-binding protein [Alkalimonas collagenimarina]MDP4535475.1 ABC transporter ATP-binding protein [Alkalimonas collagenimarina]